MLQFGPDGDLYIAVGDGDSGVLDPPGPFAQTLNDLLGNILRIDPAQSGDRPYTVPASNPFVGLAGDRPEIWVYLGDVGEGVREEIDYQAAVHAGSNFGWPCLEGAVVFDPTAVCNDPVAPLLDYGHQTNLCAVTGGVVLRDPRLPALDGWFLYSDLCGGEVDALHVADGTLARTQDLKVNVPDADSFGLDALGRAYVVSVDGPIYRIDPAG